MRNAGVWGRETPRECLECRRRSIAYTWGLPRPQTLRTGLQPVSFFVSQRLNKQKGLAKELMLF